MADPIIALAGSKNSKHSAAGMHALDSFHFASTLKADPSVAYLAHPWRSFNHSNPLISTKGNHGIKEKSDLMIAHAAKTLSKTEFNTLINIAVTKRLITPDIAEELKSQELSASELITQYQNIDLRNNHLRERRNAIFTALSQLSFKYDIELCDRIGNIFFENQRYQSLEPEIRRESLAIADGTSVNAYLGLYDTLIKSENDVVLFPQGTLDLLILIPGVLCGKSEFVPQNNTSCKLDAESLDQYAKEIKSQGKNISAIVIANPTNPSGEIYSQTELIQIAKIAAKHDIFVITDELCADLNLNEKECTHFSQIVDEVPEFDKKRYAIITGPSKRFGIEDLKLGIIFSENTELISTVRSRLRLADLDIKLDSMGLLVSSIEQRVPEFRRSIEKLKADQQGFESTVQPHLANFSINQPDACHFRILTVPKNIAATRFGANDSPSFVDAMRKEGIVFRNTDGMGMPEDGNISVRVNTSTLHFSYLTFKKWAQKFKF